jgi:hypothetical protein
MVEVLTIRQVFAAFFEENPLKKADEVNELSFEWTV